MGLCGETSKSCGGGKTPVCSAGRSSLGRTMGPIEWDSSVQVSSRGWQVVAGDGLIVSHEAVFTYSEGVILEHTEA